MSLLNFPKPVTENLLLPDFTLIFSGEKSKFVFWVVEWVLAIKSKYFSNFLKFPNFLRS